jgi:hypothetical protein
LLLSFAAMRVTETICPAWERARALLFRPFNLGTWFTFGFIFFLQDCVEGGGGNFNLPGDLGGGGGGSGGGDDYDSSDSFLHAARGASSAFDAFDGGTIAIIVVVALLVAIPLVLLAYWLGSRGQMMGVHAVAVGRPDIGGAWNATRDAGMAMFKFHLALGALGMLVLLPALGVVGLVAMPAFQEHRGFGDVLPILILVGIVAFVALLPLMLVSSLGRNFVAPIMLKHQVGAREGWRRFWAVSRGHVGALFLFFVLKGLFSVMAAIAGVVAGLLTCCIGFLPVAHQSVMAPWYVFERAWSLEILASLGPDFDLRSSPPEAYPQYPQYPQYPPPGGGGFGPPPGHWDNPYAPPGR